MKFNDKLREYRNNLGLTQEQFAKKIGMARTTITELENGSKKPTLKAIEKLTNKTNTEISFWLEDQDSEVTIKLFDGLKIVIDALYDTGEISKEGKCSEEAKTLLAKMLDKEIVLYAENKKN